MTLLDEPQMDQDLLALDRAVVRAVATLVPARRDALAAKWPAAFKDQP